MALLDDMHVSRELPLSSNGRSAQTLAPAIKQLLDAEQLTAKDLDAIAVSGGPGSFTGLRVGISTAKTLAWATKIPVVFIGTLRAIAAQAAPALSESPSPWRIVAVSNAYRKQVFTATYTFDDPLTCREVHAPTTMDVSHWKSIPSQDTWVTGPGLALMDEAWRSEHSDRLVDPRYWSPRASVVGQLGYQDLQSGKGLDPVELLPEYGRASAAEEKRNPQH